MSSMYDGVDTLTPVLCLGCVQGVQDLPHQCAGDAELVPGGGWCQCKRPGCGQSLPTDRTVSTGGDHTMKRATIVQLSAATALLGLMLVLLAGGGAPRRPEPLMNLRPATEQERRDTDRDQLREEMDRLWQQRQQQEAGR